MQPTGRLKVLHQHASLAVVARDEAKAYVVESSEYGAKDRPEIAIETDTIGEPYQEVSAKRPDLLHPNSKQVMKKPWGCTGSQFWTRLALA
jgi:hypothetical protein